MLHLNLPHKAGEGEGRRSEEGGREGGRMVNDDDDNDKWRGMMTPPQAGKHKYLTQQVERARCIH